MNQSLVQQIHQLNYLTSELDSLYHQAALRLGLSDSAMRVLYAIYDNGDGCLLHTIYQQSGISKQTVNSAIRKLEQEQILYLIPYDGRQKQIRLTPAGKDYLETTVAQVSQAEYRIFSSWAQEEIETHLHLMQKYTDAFREQIPSIHTEVMK